MQAFPSRQAAKPPPPSRQAAKFAKRRQEYFLLHRPLRTTRRTPLLRSLALKLIRSPKREVKRSSELRQMLGARELAVPWRSQTQKPPWRNVALFASWRFHPALPCGPRPPFPAKTLPWAASLPWRMQAFLNRQAAKFAKRCFCLFGAGDGARELAVPWRSQTQKPPWRNVALFASWRFHPALPCGPRPAVAKALPWAHCLDRLPR
jgi:hypothetical protein